MDFFEYASIADIMNQTFSGTINLPMAFIVGALCFAVVYIFQSVGLFTIANREGIKNKWMAFVPILNTYFIGVCGQKNRFLKVDTKIIALIATIAEALLCVLWALYYIALAQLISSGGINVNAIQDSYTGLYDVYMEASEIVASNLNWAAWYISYYNIFIGIINLVYLFTLIIILNCFFQTYAAKHYFLFTITSIFFPVQGILIFAVRNNKGMRYADYIRTIQERAYRQYRNQQNFNQNPYNQNPYTQNTYSNDYNRPPYQGEYQPDQQQKAPEDPFSEFGSSKDKGPFDEFN